MSSIWQTTCYILLVDRFLSEIVMVSTFWYQNGPLHVTQCFEKFIFGLRTNIMVFIHIWASFIIYQCSSLNHAMIKGIINGKFHIISEKFWWWKDKSVESAVFCSPAQLICHWCETQQWAPYQNQERLSSTKWKMWKQERGTVCVLTRVLFWCLFLELWKQWGK